MSYSSIPQQYNWNGNPYSTPLYPQGQNYGALPIRQGLYSRLVSDINEVRPNEVPMDGNVSIFPLKDGSCIFTKAWNADGTITTLKFVPEIIDVTDKESTITNGDILKRLDAIESLLKNRTRTNHQNKKEIVDHE